MSGSKSTNNASVDFQKQQAADAAAKETARQARLQSGTDAINAIFQGTPVTTTQNQAFDWGSATPGSSALPTGYSWSQDPASKNASLGFLSGRAGGSPASAASWGITGPTGQRYSQGQSFSAPTQVPTGATTGGFNDDFYNTYKQKYLDLYQPDETRQFAQAKGDLTANLSRQGLMDSSVAGSKLGDLTYQHSLNQADIVGNANTAEGNLRQSVDQQKQAALNQLYSTEDPTEAANLAESSAKGLQLQTPTLTPAAALFAPALTGVSNYVASITSPYTMGPGYARPQGGPAVAPAASSSCKQVTYS
jgi:hypothetical protein